MSDAVNVPQGLVPPSRRNPQSLLIYGPVKGCKTTICSLLPDSLILELEPAGADFVAARKIDIRDMAHLQAVLAHLIALREKGTPAARRLVIDTIDEVEAFCDPWALAQYKRSVLGKDFQGTSIVELPQGAGYGRLRDCMGELLWLFSKAAEEVVLVGHVREKYVERKGAQEVAAQDIALTGKVRAIVASRCSSIGYAWRNYRDQAFLNFKSSDTVTCGSRCQHLTGQEVLISERIDGVVKAYWDKVYLPDAPAAPEGKP